MSREFNGTDNYMTALVLSDLAGVSKASYSGWLYRPATGTTVSFGQQSASTYNFDFVWFSDDLIYVAVENGVLSFWTTPAQAVSGWHHLVVSYDGSLTEPVVYFDGVAQTMTLSEGSLPSTLASSANQGNWEWGRDGDFNYYAGRVADTCVWPQVALTLVEAKLLFGGADPTRIRPNFLAHRWRFDRGLSTEPDTGNWNRRKDAQSIGSVTFHEQPPQYKQASFRSRLKTFGRPAAAGGGPIDASTQNAQRLLAISDGYNAGSAGFFGLPS